MKEPFCQICRHALPGHTPDCPVGTGEPQRGWPWINQQDMQDMQYMGQQVQGQLGQMGNVATLCPHCGGLNGVHRWAGQGVCPGVNTLARQYGQSDVETRLLAELATIREELRTLRHMVGELLARK